jgi:hypothetical protein
VGINFTQSLWYYPKKSPKKRCNRTRPQGDVQKRRREEDNGDPGCGLRDKDTTTIQIIFLHFYQKRDAGGELKKREPCDAE